MYMYPPTGAGKGHVPEEHGWLSLFILASLGSFRQ